MAGKRKVNINQQSKSNSTSEPIVKDKLQLLLDDVFKLNPKRSEVFIDEDSLKYFFYESQAKRSLKNYKSYKKIKG